MKMEEVLKCVEGVPYMNESQAQTLIEFIHEHDIRSILELGFAYGVSTCYMAGALHELGEGQITTIDLENAKENSPNIEDLLGQLNLLEYCTIHYEPRSYIWRLMKMIEEDPKPRFDLCYIDGAHNWATDGFAFFLIDRLLKPGGWIIFDDLHWSYGTHMADNESVKKMPKEERETRQVEKVYELLVKPHPDYGNFIINGSWGFAQKAKDAKSCEMEDFKKEKVLIKVGVGAFLERYTKKTVRIVKSLFRKKKW